MKRAIVLGVVAIVAAAVVAGIALFMPASSPPSAVFNPKRNPAPLTVAEEYGVGLGDAFRECATCPEMVVVPAGSFTMGSPESEPERSSREGPQRQVTFARPFAVGRFAVTFEEWDAC